jgi:DNA topoisomerase-1
MVKRKPVIKKNKIFRVTMNEITKAGVKEAFEHPRQIYENLVDAQQARRVLDRLVGYQVSPILWDKVKRGLSAGRVQTVALRLIVEREREVRKFIQEEYWTIAASLLSTEPPAFDARLVEHKGEKLSIPNQEAADGHVAALQNAAYKVTSVTRKERRRNPVPPFITSTLQQDSANKLRFSGKRTMALAQRLYEGIDIGGEEGLVGLITYMRTDSTRISDTAMDELRAFIPERFGPNYLPEKPRTFKSKKKAQDAHEAVRPTSVLHTPESVKQYLKEDEFKVYQLIWQRFVAYSTRPRLKWQRATTSCAPPVPCSSSTASWPCTKRPKRRTIRKTGTRKGVRPGCRKSAKARRSSSTNSNRSSTSPSRRRVIQRPHWSRNSNRRASVGLPPMLPSFPPLWSGSMWKRLN